MSASSRLSSVKQLEHGLPYEPTSFILNYSVLLFRAYSQFLLIFWKSFQNAKADYAKTYIEKSNSNNLFFLFCRCVETQVLQSSDIEKNFPTVSIRGFNTQDQFEACFPNGDSLDKCRSIFRIEFAMLFIGLFWLFPQNKFALNDKVSMFFLFSRVFCALWISSILPHTFWNGRYLFCWKLKQLF